MLTALASETPLPASRIRQEVPERLSALIDQLLAKRPEDRVQTAAAVLEELTVDTSNP